MFSQKWSHWYRYNKAALKDELRYFECPRWIKKKNKMLLNSKVPEEIILSAEGMYSALSNFWRVQPQCNEDRQGMSAKIMSRLLELHPYYLFHNISEMNWVQCCTFTLGKTFFPWKCFCLHVMHNIFAKRSWIPKRIYDWSLLGMEKSQHFSTSIVLFFASNRYQWLSLSLD